MPGFPRGWARRQSNLAHAVRQYHTYSRYARHRALSQGLRPSYRAARRRGFFPRRQVRAGPVRRYPRQTFPRRGFNIHRRR